MPQLKFKGINENDLVEISTVLVNELQCIINCPREYFTLEYISSINIFDGKKVVGPSFIEVCWFDRGQEIQDIVAQKITKIFSDKGYTELDIVFITFKENCYYENGIHF